MDGDVLETLLDYLKDLLALTHLDAVYAVFADFTLNLVLFFGCASFVGFLATGLQFDDFDVLGEDWNFDVLGRRSFLAGVVSNEVQLLAVLLILTMPISTSRLLPPHLLPVSDQHFLLKVITILHLLNIMKRRRCILLISLIRRPQMLLNGLILFDNFHLIPYFFPLSHPLSLKRLLFILTLIDDVRVDSFYLIASVCDQRREIFDVIGSVATVHYFDLAEV